MDEKQWFQEVVVTAPINIALVKYWGKRNQDLMLPLNDSVSLSINDVYAETRIRVGASISEDSVSLNGSVLCLKKYPQFVRCFAVISKTSFPVEAGLASSAAGFAAIAYGLGKIYQLTESEIVRVARLGSGSACRSILSGLVHWKAGSEEDGKDCVCETLFQEGYWPTLRALILVTSHDAKGVSSSLGMQDSVATSKLLQARIKGVPEQITRLRDAFHEKNFEKFAEITMSESGQLHAVCMDTMPPLKYLNESSWYLIRLVHALNRHWNATKLAYTFDAGPNCCLFLEAENVPLALAAISKYCKLPSSMIEQVMGCCAASEYGNLKELMQKEESTLVLFDSGKKSIERNYLEPTHDVVKDLFLSHVGSGPALVKTISNCAFHKSHS